MTKSTPIDDGAMGELNRAYAEISRLEESRKALRERNQYLEQEFKDMANGEHFVKLRELQQQNDELRAHIVRLGFDVKFLIDYLEERHGEYIKTGLVYLSGETPEQSLAEIKAQAIREMLDEVWRSDTERSDIEEHATNLENESKQQ